MNQKDLEYFVKVVEAGSFSQASIFLGIAQPAISRHVKDLESELKINLLYRNGRGVTMTEAGERLYVRANTILDQMMQARSEALNISGNGIISAVVGMPPSVARVLTLPLSQALGAVYPDAKLRFIEAFNGYLLEMLTSARLDAAIIYATEATQRMNVDPLSSENMHLISGPGRTTPSVTITAANLSGVPLVLPSRPHGLRYQLDMWAARNGIELNIKFECDSFCSLLELVQDGAVSTILPEAPLRDAIERGALSSALIVDPHVQRTLVLSTPANRPVTAGIAEFMRMIKQVVRSQGTADGL